MCCFRKELFYINAFISMHTNMCLFSVLAYRMGHAQYTGIPGPWQTCIHFNMQRNSCRSSHPCVRRSRKTLLRDGSWAEPEGHMHWTSHGGTVGSAWHLSGSSQTPLGFRGTDGFTGAKRSHMKAHPWGECQFIFFPEDRAWLAFLNLILASVKVGTLQAGWDGVDRSQPLPFPMKNRGSDVTMLYDIMNCMTSWHYYHKHRGTSLWLQS